MFENYLLGNRNIIQFIKINPMEDVIMTSMLGILIYGFHMWQEDIFIRKDN